MTPTHTPSEFDPDEAWVLRVIEEAQEEERRHPMTDEAFRQEVEKAQRYGAERAQVMGITEEDVDRIVYEERQKRKKSKSFYVDVRNLGRIPRLPF